MENVLKISAEESDEIINDKARVIENKITSHGRWSVGHTVVFKYGDELYRARYSVGATEYQDSYEPTHYECTRVVPVEKTVTVYEAA